MGDAIDRERAGELNAFDVDQKSTSIFAQGTWNFTPQLRATAGARAVRELDPVNDGRIR